MVDKSRQIDYRGLDLLVDSINGESTGEAPTFSDLDGSVSGAAGTNLQAILEDIVTRLAAVETP